MDIERFVYFGFLAQVLQVRQGLSRQHLRVTTHEQLLKRGVPLPFIHYFNDRDRKWLEEGVEMNTAE